MLFVIVKKKREVDTNYKYMDIITDRRILHMRECERCGKTRDRCL